jgi:hypothetical protein
MYENLEKRREKKKSYFLNALMVFIVLMETYLHERSFFVSFDQFVVNRHNRVDYTFGSICVEMPFSGINCFCIRT